MFVTVEGTRVCVRLSRRNLQQLEAILDNPRVADRCLARKDERGVALVVHAEEDADHYEGRDSGPRTWEETSASWQPHAVAPTSADDFGSLRKVRRW
jgi:hypothetical protein